MNRDQLAAAIQSIAGPQLTPAQIRLIIRAADAYAAGDCPEVQAHRRRVLSQAAEHAHGRALGRARRAG